MIDATVMIDELWHDDVFITGYLSTFCCKMGRHHVKTPLCWLYTVTVELAGSF